MDTDALIACPECDALHRKPPLQSMSIARCARCDAVLYRQFSGKFERMLAVLITALIALLIANGFPIVELKSNGLTSRTTLFGAIQHLSGTGEPLVALIVLASTIVLPALELCALLWLFVPLSRGHRPRGFVPVLRSIQAIRPWGMIEVFMLGVLVTLVKLSSIARVIPEAALFAFGALTMLLAFVLVFDLRQLWEIADALPLAPRRAPVRPGGELRADAAARP
jgi:paraquat-inducible protein A